MMVLQKVHLSCSERDCAATSSLRRTRKCASPLSFCPPCIWSFLQNHRSTDFLRVHQRIGWGRGRVYRQGFPSSSDREGLGQRVIKTENFLIYTPALTQESKPAPFPALPARKRGETRQGIWIPYPSRRRSCAAHLPDNHAVLMWISSS